jgi:hypothetical protein
LAAVRVPTSQGRDGCGGIRPSVTETGTIRPFLAMRPIIAY